MKESITEQNGSRFKFSSERAEFIRRDPPQNLSVPEGAAYIGISVRALWDLISSGKLKARRIGKRTILRLVDIQSFLDRA